MPLTDRVILQHLSEVGSYEQQSACRQQLEEITGSLRFVRYELERKGSEEALPAPQLGDIQVSQLFLRCRLPVAEDLNAVASEALLASRPV